MNQVQEIKPSIIARAMEGIGMFFKALSENENAVIEPEELVQESGIKELINSSKRIKEMEVLFEEKGTSIKKVKAKLNSEKSEPKIKNSIINVNTQNSRTIEEIDDSLER